MKYELKNYSFGQTIGKGLNLYFDNFLYIVGVSLIFNSPTFYSAFFTVVSEPEDFNATGDYTLLYFIIIDSFISAFITHVASKKYLGKTLSIRDYFLARLPLLLSVLLLSLLVNLPLFSILLLSLLSDDVWLGLGMILLFIPWLILVVGFSVSVNALVMEQVSVIESFRRSWRLTKGKRWFIFALLLLLKIILFIMIFGISTLITKVGLDGDLERLAVIIAYLLLNAMIFCVFVVIYYNLRIEKEGFSVEHLADQFSLSSDPE